MCSQASTDAFSEAAGRSALLFLPARLPLRHLDTGYWGTLRRVGRGPLHQPPRGSRGGAEGAPLSPTAPQPAGGPPAAGRAPGAARFAEQLLGAPTPGSGSRSPDYDWPAATFEAWRHFLPSQRALPASLSRAATTPRSRPKGRGRTGHLPRPAPFPTQQSLRTGPLLFAVDQKGKGGRGKAAGTLGRSHRSPGGPPGPTSAAALPSIGVPRAASAAAPSTPPSSGLCPASAASPGP